MTKEEFEQRIGLVITDEEYAGIERDYYKMLSGSAGKDKFVKKWLREGGIQGLFDKRLLEAGKQRAYVENILKENNEVWKRANDYVTEIQDLKKQLESLKGKLAAISGLAATAA